MRGGREADSKEAVQSRYAGKHTEDLLKGAEYEGVVALVHYEKGFHKRAISFYA
jgi:hypothetical protein